MTDSHSNNQDRRRTLQQIAGFGAAAGALPLLDRIAGGQSPMSLIPQAFAQGINSGAAPGEAATVLVRGADADAVPLAEWERGGPAGPEFGRFRIAQGAEAVSNAPEGASHYTAKTFDFPGGALRVLHWKAGVPVKHQITFETEIMVLEGSLSLTPLHAVPGIETTLGPGDAISLPSGILHNTSPDGDTVILQAFVRSTEQNPKRRLVRAEDAPLSHSVQWTEDGKPVTARTPEEIAKAPASATRFTVQRYAFDGNSMRRASFEKGGATHQATPSRSDVILYMTKGRMRRIQGNETFEVAAGDAVCETLDTPGYWEILEDSEFVSTDAPLQPQTYYPALTGKSGDDVHKFMSMVIDENGRSYAGFVDMPLNKISETEAISEKQEGLYWRIGYRPRINEEARTSKSYENNSGPYEMHVGGVPHYTGCMKGNIESTMQDGSVWRRAAGDFCYITPGALHNSNFRSDITAVYFNLYLPGTEEDTQQPDYS